MSIVRDLFGAGTWGTGGNMVAWVICGIFAGLWLRSKMKAQHAAAAVLARLHHQEMKKQAAEQHAELKELAGKHHQEILDRADVHHEALKAHVTAAAKPAPRKPAGGM